MARSAGPASGAETAVYVYGVVRAGPGAEELLSGVAGVDGASPVELVESDGLAALTSRVGLAEFGREELEANLADLGWLAPRARAHDVVLERALAGGAVVPFRFGALFRGRDDVRTMLAAERGRLERALERVAGKVELGVKAILAPDALAERVRRTSEQARRLAEQVASAEGGRAYLLGRQLEQLTAREAAARRDAIARESHAALAEAAAEARANPVQRADVGGFEGEMLLNGAYLVARDGEAAFTAVVDDLRARHSGEGVRYEQTGPWPPYNFVDSDGEA